MANLPNITTEQVESVIQQASNVTEAGRGGQKLVFRGVIEGTPYALKFAKVAVDPEEMEEEEFSLTDVSVRAKREVETMRECSSPHIVKLGPIGLDFSEINGEHVLYFSEEFIEGDDLRNTFMSSGPFEQAELVKLGLDITDAISAVWKLKRIHRDIKPANIMRRARSG